MKENSSSIPDTSPASKAFKDAGIYIMRSSRIYLAALCQAVGVNGLGPHKHNDWLSFELSIDEIPIFIDPGTYCYTGDLKARQMFRSTAYHNTVVVDDTDQISNKRGVFALENVHGDIKIRKWESNAQRDILIAEHTGYTRLSNPLVHRRSFILDKLQHTVEIKDTFEGDGEHLIEWHLHLDSNLDCEIEGSNTFIYLNDKEIISMQLLGSNRTFQIKEGWISKAYNKSEKAEVMYLRWVGKLKYQFGITINLLPIDSC